MAEKVYEKKIQILFPVSLSQKYQELCSKVEKRSLNGQLLAMINFFPGDDKFVNEFSARYSNKVIHYNKNVVCHTFRFTSDEYKQACLIAGKTRMPLHGLIKLLLALWYEGKIRSNFNWFSNSKG